MKMLDDKLSGPFTDTQTAQPIRRGPVDSWLLGAVLLLILSGELFVLDTTYFMRLTASMMPIFLFGNTTSP